VEREQRSVVDEIELGSTGIRYSSPSRRRAASISLILAAVIGLRSLLSPAAQRASATSLSFTEDNTAAHSISHPGHDG